MKHSGLPALFPLVAGFILMHPIPALVDPLPTTPAWVMDGDQVSAALGAAVAGAGDVNGDGLADILTAAPLFDNGESNEGVVYLFLGSGAGPEHIPAWVFEGGSPGAEIGHAIAGAGDVNGDGYADVIVGDPQYAGGGSGRGRVLVFLGSASGLAATPSWSIDGDQDGARLGAAVASAGDVDDDGFAVLVKVEFLRSGQRRSVSPYLEREKISCTSRPWPRLRAERPTRGERSHRPVATQHPA